jgi:hypothetical protein
MPTYWHEYSLANVKFEEENICVYDNETATALGVWSDSPLLPDLYGQIYVIQKVT